MRILIATVLVLSLNAGAVPQLGTGWTSGKYGDYQLLDGSLTKPECDAECGLLSASIPSIHSFDENKEVWVMAETSYVWLGATKTGGSRDTYVWDDGSEWSITNFADWSDENEAYHCIWMDEQSKWWESLCDERAGGPDGNCLC